MADSAWMAVSELAAAQHGAFTRAQASVCGLDDRRLATGLRTARIAVAGPNLFVFTGGPRPPRQGLMVATLAGCGSRASHRAAGHLHGFDGLEQLTVEVSVLAHQRWRPPSPDMVVHRVKALPRLDVVTVDGIPCTGIARTLCDLGSVVDSDVVLKALIGQHARGVSLEWCRRTALAVDAPGRNGARVLLGHLRALATAGTVPASWLEEVIRRIVDHPALPTLVSHHVLRDAGGKFVAEFDHAFPDVRLAIEAHSRQFHFGPIAEPADEDRDLRVAREGWEIVYLGWYAKRRPAEVVDAIADVVAQRRAASAA